MDLNGSKTSFWVLHKITWFVFIGGLVLFFLRDNPLSDFKLDSDFMVNIAVCMFPVVVIESVIFLAGVLKTDK